MKTLPKFALAVVCVAALAQPLMAQDLTGAGSTFINIMMTKWSDVYATKTGVKINYQSIGSGGGVRQFMEQTIDFGASDAPMSDEEMSKAKGGHAMHFPVILGAVVVSYNLPEVKKALRLDGPVLADIFLGKVTKWNDARIAALNKGVALPATDILVVHRSDGSGTTFVFTDYLSNVSADWAAKPGKGKDIQWPVGLGGKGNEGVAGQLKQIPGSIGYVELAYARQNKLEVADMKNAAGEFITPTVASTTAAAAGAAARLPANTDYRVSIVNAAGKGVYPISSFSWLLIYSHQTDATKGKKLEAFVHWILTDGQKLAEPLDYAPIPESMSRTLLQRLSTITMASK